MTNFVILLFLDILNNYEEFIEEKNRLRRQERKRLINRLIDWLKKRVGR